MPVVPKVLPPNKDVVAGLLPNSPPVVPAFVEGVVRLNAGLLAPNPPKPVDKVLVPGAADAGAPNNPVVGAAEVAVAPNPPNAFEVAG